MIMVPVPRDVITRVFCLSIDHYDTVLTKIVFHLLEGKNEHDALDLLLQLHDLCSCMGPVFGQIGDNEFLDLDTVDLSDLLTTVSLIKTKSLLVLGEHKLTFESESLERQIVALIRGGFHG